MSTPRSPESNIKLLKAFAKYGLLLDNCGQLANEVAKGNWENVINHLDDYLRVMCAESVGFKKPKTRNAVKLLKKRK